MDNEILQRLNQIEKRHKNLKRALGVSLAMLVLSLLNLSFTKEDKFDLIRTKGIIIEDEKGRDRILIGTPVPSSRDRVRTDTAKVRKYWASQFPDPDQYMGWYKEYKNTAEGIVFLNDKGFDVVQVGNDLSDPNVGKRLFRFNGMLWNTQTGWERGGAGINTTADRKSRPAIGLDDESGEALHMICLEDGSKGIIIADENGSLRIGMAKKDGDLFRNKGAFTGIKYFDNKGAMIWEQKMDTTVN